MQNHIVSNVVKSLWQALPYNMAKGVPNFSQQRYNSSSMQNEVRNVPVLLPGGGLEKLQGRFKEEQYFYSNDHLKIAQIQKAGNRLKCENNTTTSNWKEYERMANACSNLIAIRHTTDMLNKYENVEKESLSLQDQRSLLERILDIIRNLTRPSQPPYPPPYPPHSPYNPYGHHPYGSPYYQNMPGSEGKPAETQNAEEDNDETTGDATPADDDAATATENDEGGEQADQADSDVQADQDEQANSDVQADQNEYADQADQPADQGGYDDSHGGHSGGGGDGENK